MMTISRRGILGLLGGTMLVSPLSLTRAEPVTIAIAIVAAVDAIMNMMKQGGDMELLVKSLSAKLDAILANQLTTIAAIAAVDQKVSDLLAIVPDIPSETVVLGTQIAAADATKQLIRAANDHNDRDYQRFRASVLDSASIIETSARSAVTTPSLAVAAWNALNGVSFIATREYGRFPVKEDAKLCAASSDLRQAFTTMLSSESKMSRRLADVRNRIKKLDEAIAANPSAKVTIPPNFGQVTDSAPAFTPTALNVLTLCARRHEGLVLVETTPISYSHPAPGVMGMSGPPTPQGGSTWSRESVSHRRMPITVSGRTVPGGRQLVMLDIAPSQQWARGVWSREVNKAWGVQVPQAPRRVADARQLDGCVDLTPLDPATELPVSMIALKGLLDSRNALTAMEASFVGLRILCDRALKRCDEIDGGSA